MKDSALQPEVTSRAARGRWPVELRLIKGRKLLNVRFDDGLEETIPVSLLRVYSPSAEVQGHSKARRFLKADKSDVEVRSIERVGSYAIRLVFSDGHSSGFYTWSFLEDFALNLEAKTQSYQNAMTASRDAHPAS
ncbi:MAG: gamma-butyrobetaine hydroxylase-like domain-containing protein [Pseudomonadota bacterium]